MRVAGGLDRARAGARFVRTLSSLLHHPIDAEQARIIVRHRFEHREATFLAIVQRTIFARPTSPYRRLFEGVGCEYGDLERMVRANGVEGALRTLFSQGVYVAVDEFKGRRPIVRGSLRIDADPNDFLNPFSEKDVAASSSGSRGQRTSTMLSLSFIRDCASATCLFLVARGGSRWHKATWETPAGGAVFRILKYSSFGRRVSHWFSQIDPKKPRLEPRFRRRIAVVRVGSVLARCPLPGPRYTPLDAPVAIVRWMRGVISSGGTPHLFTFASSAVRLAQAALDSGMDLNGAQLTIGGEPITAARLAAVRAAGGTAAPRYGSIEAGPVGYACLAPKAPDEVHVLHDLHTVIQAEPGPGSDSLMPSGALLITSLLPSAPFVFLNVSMGDQGVLATRACGCPLEEHGWTTHLDTVRSFEKLTGAGTTFLGVDAVRVLEEVLPGRFGGIPTDYQLAEEESTNGEPRLCLIVHPRLGPLSEAEITETFLTNLATGPRDTRVRLWREAALVRVARRPPVATASGKILHLVGQSSSRAADHS